MILILTLSDRAREIADALRMATREDIQLESSMRRATSVLHQQEFTAVVVDEDFVDAQPGSAEILLEKMGTALPIFLNFAIYRNQRIVRDVQSALRRRVRDLLECRRKVTQELKSFLNNDLTALLISSELALKSTVQEETDELIRSVLATAKQLRQRLSPEDSLSQIHLA